MLYIWFMRYVMTIIAVIKRADMRLWWRFRRHGGYR